MNNYLEARQCLRNGVTFQQFKQKLPTSLTESGLLSLLIGAVMEQGLEPFEQYLQLLLMQGADANYCQYQSKPTINGVKMSLLMFACKKTKISVVKTFLKHPGLQVFHRDQNGKNTLHYAIQNQDQEEAKKIVHQLIRLHPLLRDMGNYPKGNYLTLAIREGKTSLLRVLLEEDINPHFKSLEGLGPLHQTVRAHKNHKSKEITEEMLKALLEAGCKEEEENNEGQTYINYAKQKGFLQESEIDEIMEEVTSSKTPKATIQTSPEQKHQQIFSIESGEIHPDNFSEEERQSESEEKEELQLNHYQISKQMFELAQTVQKQHQRVGNLILPFYKQIEKMVQEYYGTVEVIGSFASHLWIPSSDIDILLIIPDGGNPTFFDEIADILYKRILQMGSYTSVKLIRTYKLPLIKIVLSQQFEKIELQLFLSCKKNIASRYVIFTNQIMTYYPETAVIYYVLRKLLSLKKLHDHRTGGLKAYALFLLIYSMRNMYQYPYVSQFVEHFCYYYGFAYDYQVQAKQEGEIEYHINIVDPLNSENNMGGKRTDILSLQETLKKIYYGLNTTNAGSKMDYISDILKYL